MAYIYKQKCSLEQCENNCLHGMTQEQYFKLKMEDKIDATCNSHLLEIQPVEVSGLQQFNLQAEILAAGSQNDGSNQFRHIFIITLQ